MAKLLCTQVCAYFGRPGETYRLSRVYEFGITDREHACPGCALLTKILDIAPERLDDDDSYFVWFSNSGLDDKPSPYGALTMGVDSGHHYWGVVITAIKGKQNPWGLGAPSGPNSRVLRFDDDTSSPHTLALAAQWLQNCLQNHNSCKGQHKPSPPLPSRVIDIGGKDSQVVTLRESHNLKGRYICLSYCWGGTDFVQTTTANIQTHLKEIRLTALPQVFQDFIKVAKTFWVRYVWIDALCIIQDNEEDWQCEAGRMAEIYSNSFLTVAAAAAANPQSGLFGTRNPTVVDGVECRIVDHFPYKSRSYNFPLMSRGWTYQERVLSPRVLYFTSNEMSWECRQSRACECGLEIRSYLPSSRILYPTPGQTTESGGAQQWSTWQDIVKQYTELDLTKSTDRLPALSGVADYIGRVRKEDYFAGLWSGSLFLDLLWYRPTRIEGYNRCKPRPKEKLSKPWAAPTWSWASVDWPVSYISPNSRVITAYCEVMAAVCIPAAGESKTAQLKSAYLKLRCQMLEAKILKRVNWGPVLEIQGHRIIEDTYLDYYDESTPNQEVKVIRVVKTGGSDSLVILQEAGDPNNAEYTRLGIAHSLGYDSDLYAAGLQWPEEKREIVIF